MSYINMDSILAKASNYIDNGDGRKKVDRVVTEAMTGKIKMQINGKGKRMKHTPEEAAITFINVLKNSIGSSGLSSDAINAISNLEYEPPKIIGSNMYTIEINFTGDLSRPSLDVSRYGSIKNLAALFNNGVDHVMKQVHGVWHGKEAWSRTEIPGVRFMEQAKHTFMSSYASEYNVVSIDFDDEFA